MKRVLATLAIAALGPAASWALDPVPAPTVTGPVTGGVRTGGPYNASLFDLSLNGYVEQEYFLSGMARDYVNGAADAAYTTRVVVRKPIDPARFSGTVYVEWLNVTGQVEVEAQYAYVIAEILREGHVAVILSAQQAGVNTTRSWDLARYAALSHPGDDYSFDIASQAARALRNPPGLDPLAGLAVEQVLLGGESQSASRAAAYVNDVYPLVEPVFDGFLIEVGGGNSFRADLDVPVLQVQSEREAGGGPPDSAFYRRWEIAGGSHQDRYSLSYVGATGERDHGLAPGTFPLNPPDLPDCIISRSAKYLVLRAALHHLDRWARDGTPPPIGDRLQFESPGVLARDADGNALGGIRLPFVEVPIATYIGDEACNDNPLPLTDLGGITIFFDSARLAELYTSQAHYESLLRQATEASVAEGFLLPADANYWFCRDFQLGEEQLFSPERDCDGDGVAYSVDACTHVFDPGQEDFGGVATSTADGIGNACQCGDVTGNGVVNGQDAHAIRRHGLGAENPLFIAPEHCDVTGNGACNGQDAIAVQREALGLEPNPLFGTYACESARGDL